MRKRILILIAIILIIGILFTYFKISSLKFNLNSNEIYSIEYSFDCYSNGIGYIKGEVTDKEILNNTVSYLNKISLLISFTKTKGATQWLGFKDKNGNLIKGYAFGCGDLWVGNKTYMFGDAQINKVKELLNVNDKK